MAALAAAAAALHAVESAVIPYFQPWRLGLANTVTIIALARCGVAPAVAVVLCRCLLGGLLSGQFPGLPFALSLAGGLASAAVMAAMIRRDRWFSLYGVSLAGALASNAAQLGVLFLSVANISALFSLVVWLWPAAMAGGVICGLLAQAVLARLEDAAPAPPELSSASGRSAAR